MKKSTLSKIIVLIIIFVLMGCMTTTVFAEGQLDLNSLTGSGTNNEGDEGVDDLSNQVNTDKNTNTNTNTDTNTNTNTNTDTNTNTNTDTNTNTGTSTYEESDIPYAGPEDTILMVSAFIVFGIIGVYTFIKMSDYSNI